jgi:hypothetical protein
MRLLAQQHIFSYILAFHVIHYDEPICSRNSSRLQQRDFDRSPQALAGYLENLLVILVEI